MNQFHVLLKTEFTSSFVVTVITFYHVFQHLSLNTWPNVLSEEFKSSVESPSAFPIYKKEFHLKIRNF